MSYHITSNGKPIPFTPVLFQEMTETVHLDAEYLRQRYLNEGYVLFRGVLDKEKVLRMRQQYFEQFADTIFREGTSRTEGIFSGKLQYKPSEHGLEHHPASAFVRTAIFDEFTRNPTLFELSASLLGAHHTAILPRRPIRHFYKDTFCATRAHADFTYLDKGTQRLLSVWVPLGDVRMDGGSIVYLRGSHKLNHEDLRARLNGIGQRSGDERPISDDLEAVATLAGEPWMYTNFSAGDVVMHSPFIIHATLDCNTDAMRLSTDLRFAVADDEIDYRWKGAWRGDDGF